MKSIFFIIISLSVFNVAVSQQVTGSLTNHKNQKVYLYSFENLEAKVIDSSLTDHIGNFVLKFAPKDYGMGYLLPQNQKPLIIVLANEAIEILGDAMDLSATSKINKGAENLAFIAYAKQSGMRDNALNAWTYLNKLYVENEVFSQQKQQQKAILKEINRIKTEDSNFINALPSNSYMRWYLPLRKLLASVSVVAQYKPEEIPATREALRKIDFTNNWLYKSGILKETIENHIWFLENSSGGLDQVFADLNESIDLVVKQLKNDNEKFNLVTKQWFQVLEQRSLFTSSEYLAKKLLTGNDCGCLKPDFEKQLHQYGKMAKGGIASDITFTDFTYFPENVRAKKLSELKSKYVLVVFAAGWCGHCNEAMPKLVELYPQLQAKNIEVVLVSLDENPNSFAKFAAPLPFISTTDYLKWDGQIVKDYHIYSTPTYYILNNQREIVLKPYTVEQIGAWIKLLP